jgi:hypothetical protein
MKYIRLEKPTQVPVSTLKGCDVFGHDNHLFLMTPQQAVVVMSMGCQLLPLQFFEDKQIENVMLYGSIINE